MPTVEAELAARGEQMEGQLAAAVAEARGDRARGGVLPVPHWTTAAAVVLRTSGLGAGPDGDGPPERAGTIDGGDGEHHRDCLGGPPPPP